MQEFLPADHEAFKGLKLLLIMHVKDRNCCILGLYFRFIVRIADSTLFNLRTTRVENSNTLALACECSLRCTRQKNLYLFSFSSTEAASLS